MTTVRTARAWVYKEQLRGDPRAPADQRGAHCARALVHLRHALHKVEPMKDVAAMVRRHLEGIVAWAQTRQTNGFLEALWRPVPGRQAPRARLLQLRDDQDTVIFLIAGKLDFAAVNPHAR